VRSGIGSNTTGHGASPETPFATLAYAVTQCTAGAHDIIYLMPGHVETVAVTITPLASTKIVGLGTGQNVPRITPAANNLIAFTVSAANVTFENIYINESTVAATATVFAITGRHCHLRGLHMDMGADDRIGIRVGALGCYPVIEDCVVQVTDDGPDSWIACTSANVDLPLVRRNIVIASDGTDAFDDGVVNFGDFALRNPVVVDNEFNGAGAAVASIVGLAGPPVGPLFAGNRVAGLATSQDNVAAGTVDLFDASINRAKLGADTLLTMAGAGTATAVVKTAIAASAGAGSQNVFTVAGGRVLIHGIVGQVTTICQGAQTRVQLDFNSTGAGAAFNVSAVVDLNAAAVGTLLGLTGAAADALTLGYGAMCRLPLVVDAGSIRHTTADAANTGALAYTCYWSPITVGATVVAA
jgi:hypothetical protein